MLIAAALLGALAISSHAAPMPVSGGAVAQAVEFIQRNKARPGAALSRRSPKVFALTEDQVNAYVGGWISTMGRRGRRQELVVRSAQVRFEDARVVEVDGVAHLDASALRQLDSLGDSFLMRKLKDLISTDNSVHLACAMSAEDGQGRLEVREVSIKGVPIPAFLVREILELVGRAQRPKLDFAGALPLPNGIESVQVQPGSLHLVVRPI